MIVLNYQDIKPVLENSVLARAASGVIQFLHLCLNKGTKQIQLYEEKPLSSTRWDFWLGIALFLVANGGVSLGTALGINGHLSTGLFIVAVASFIHLIRNSMQFSIYLILFISPLTDFKLIYLYIWLAVASVLLQTLFKEKVYYLATPFNKWTFFLFAYWFFKTVFSNTPHDSLKSLSFHLVALGVGSLLIFFVQERKNLIHAVYSITISAAVVSLIGMMQYFILDATDPAWVEATLNPTLNVRVFSTLINPNILAQYLVLVIPFAAALFLYEKNSFYKKGLSVCLLTMAACLLLTYSRASWVAFGLIFIISIILYNKYYILPLLLAVIPVFFISGNFLNRVLSLFFGMQDTSVLLRLSIWEIAVKVADHNPLAGLGFGNGAFLYMHEIYRDWMPPVAHAHSLYLELLVQTGIIGLLLFFCWIYVFLNTTYQAIKKSEDRFQKLFLTAGLLSLIGILINGLVEYTWYSPHIILFFWIVLGIIVTLFKLHATNKPHFPAPLKTASLEKWHREV